MEVLSMPYLSKTSGLLSTIMYGQHRQYQQGLEIVDLETAPQRSVT